jgi:hypothetical protein
VLSDPLALAAWWPSVYLRVDELAPADANGLGQRVRLLTKGWLPYTLQWDLVVTRSEYPHRLEIAAAGDFVGRGVWTFVQDGGDVQITYDWQVSAEKPLLRALSPVLRPLFAANHRWAMEQGERSLALELARRRASTRAERAAVPPPPGPVTYAAVALLAAAAAGGAGLAYLMMRSRSRRR